MERSDKAVQFDYSAHRTLNALGLAQGSRPNVICKHLCARKHVLSSGVSHVSSMVVLSRAFLHEHLAYSGDPYQFFDVQEKL